MKNDSSQEQTGTILAFFSAKYSLFGIFRVIFAGKNYSVGNF